MLVADCVMAIGVVMALVGMLFVDIVSCWWLYLAHLNQRDQRAAEEKMH